jgi:hypothetical protein
MYPSDADDLKGLEELGNLGSEVNGYSNLMTGL